jgi:ABC-type phosphate transport system permease subunit
VQQSPIIVNIVPAPEHQVSFVDVILGSFALTAVAILVALVLGVLLAIFLVRWHRRRPPELDRLPPISPLIPDPTASHRGQTKL